MAALGTVVVTGATGGLGKAASLELARRGAHVVMVCRDEKGGSAARREVADKSGAPADMIAADLSSHAAVRRLANDIDTRYGAISALVNTAGIYAGTRRLSADGLESMFAVNHLAPYLLTRLLLPALGRGAPSRIVVVSAPAGNKPDFADLQGEKKFSALRAFGVSKTSNLLFAFALARRVDPAGITVNAFHPGLMKTGLMRESALPLRVLLNLMSRSPDKAAVWLADLVTGATPAPNGAFVALKKVAKPPATTTQPGLQEQMWQVSAALTGLPQ